MIPARPFLPVAGRPPPLRSAGRRTLARAQLGTQLTCRNHGYSEPQEHCTDQGSVSMGTEYILTDDDKPAAEPSLAEDVIEIRLLTAGEPTGPANIGWAQEHHNL